MVTALLVGLVLGLVLAIPSGPIAIAILRQALAGQARAGRAMALGAATMDILYAGIAGWASSALVESCQGTMRDHAWGLLAVQGACIVVLMGCGLRYLRTPACEVAAHARQEAQARTRSAASPYLLGVLLALAALASPTFLPALIFLTGVVQARGWVGHDVGAHVVYAIGFGTGSACWFVLLLRTLTPLRARLSPQLLPRLSRVAGGAMLLCAGLLTYHLVTATPWARLPAWPGQHVGW
jgi:threonine/homoserine/homoserine lactone efflux protein